MPEPIGTQVGTESDAGSNVELDNLDSALDSASLPDNQGEPPDNNAPEPEGEPENEVESGTEGSQDGQAPKQDGRVIPQWVRDLKEKNPEAYKSAKADLFDLKDRRSVHPTVRAAREEHDLVQSLGGPDGVSKIREDVSFLHDAQSQFAKGDPAFTDDLWKEDPIAAALHVAPMLEHYAKHDPEGYKATVARQWNNEFDAVGFTPALDNLLKAIQSGDKDGALEIAKSIQGWQQSVVQTAKRADDPRVKTLLAERASRHDKQAETEQAEFITSYKTEAINQVVAEGAKVFDSFFKGRNLSKEDRNDLLRESLSIANRAIMADKEFLKQQSAHLERKDSHSALRLTQARYAREFPEAVKKVARRYGMVSGTKANPTQQKQQPNGNPNLAAPAGWVRVNTRPLPEELDRSRTSNDMILSGKAILRTGKKVDWSHLKKAAAAS